VSINIWIAVFWLFIIGINIFGALGFAEEEFWSSCLKLITISMFFWHIDDSGWTGANSRA